MQKVYITTGLPGSGKSSWAGAFANSDYNIKIVNADSFRTMLHGRYTFNVATEPCVHECCKSMVRCLLEQGFDVIIDECNVSKAVRKGWISYIRSLRPEIEIHSVIFYTSADVCKQNKLVNNYGLPSGWWYSVVDKIAANYQPVSKSEGFDHCCM